jgi:hypothetical protein
MRYPHETEDHALGLELKRRLLDPRLNLSTLAQLCGIEVRTIRWIRNTKRIPGPMLVAQIGPWWYLALTRETGPTVAQPIEEGHLSIPAAA